MIMIFQKEGLLSNSNGNIIQNHSQIMIKKDYLFQFS